MKGITDLTFVEKLLPTALVPRAVLSPSTCHPRLLPGEQRGRGSKPDLPASMRRAGGDLRHPEQGLGNHASVLQMSLLRSREASD